MKPTISVIVPAFNEERTLPSIIEIVRSWGKAEEIVVVDDGSTDQTSACVRQFLPTIALIRHRKNEGKAAAMVDGIKKTSGDIIMFLDADTIGLTYKDLDAMVHPVLSGSSDMVLGAARFWSAGKVEPFNGLTGQRVVLRKHIGAHLDSMRHVGYGVELFLNKKHHHLRVKTVKLPHVFILGKFEKQTLPDALMSYLKEIRELLTELITQYADEIGPHAKKIFEKIIRYIVRIIEILT